MHECHGSGPVVTEWLSCGLTAAGTINSHSRLASLIKLDTNDIESILEL
jgi:hypothetical protein